MTGGDGDGTGKPKREKGKDGHKSVDWQMGLIGERLCGFDYEIRSQSAVDMESRLLVLHKEEGQANALADYGDVFALPPFENIN